MAANINDNTGEKELNDFNISMRSQPWFVEWHRARGLNPGGNGNRKLSGREQNELEQMVIQHMFDGRKPEGMTIDSGGSLNQKGGWAGMPTWAKIAVIGAATVATAGAAGAFSGGAAAGSAAAGGGSAIPTIGSTALGTGMATAAPSIAGSTAAIGGGAAAAAPSLMGRIAGFAKNPLVQAGSRMLAGAADASAQNRGATIDAQLAHDQLNLQAQRERRDAETDAYRKSLFGQLAEGYQPSSRPAGAEGRHPQGFITDEARQAGSLMTDIAMNRMKTNDYPSITPFSQLPTRPGTMERIANYAAPALSLFDPRLYGR
jgi:hypothetical protein